jgi:hypothetical protein
MDFGANPQSLLRVGAGCVKDSRASAPPGQEIIACGCVARTPGSVIPSSPESSITPP